MSGETSTSTGGSGTAITGSAHYEDFLEFFFSQAFTEPHSTKPREDARRLGPRDRRRDAGRDPARAAA